MSSASLCGVDEAGRGPLVGAVYAAAVVLGPDHGIVGLADSKKLSEARREQLAALIRKQALAWSIASASAAEIDQLNILNATMLAMRRAVEGLAILPDEVLVDGNRVPALNVPARAIVKGDATVAEISAASILAKTARDESMRQLHQLHPRYGFDRHKGYPTEAHLQALEQWGVLSEHRRSFGPVKQALQLGQRSLFQ
ncbi:MAG: ribonuclease HII [Neisseriaceae bacterium]|jgi:ribonuclease HII|nr:Ribonuclease [Pseudomonadota bacterium]RTK99293.1 MAG: ribonuclease HII [Neisseriaceae bacterium]